MCLSCIIHSRELLLSQHDFPQIMKIFQRINDLSPFKIIKLANLFKKQFKNEKKDNIFDKCLKMKKEELSQQNL